MGISTDSDFQWTAKGDWQTSVYRNLLRSHIMEGGTGNDPVGREIILRYIGALMLSSDFQKVVARYRFNAIDLKNVISAAISAGLSGDIPSPFIQDGIPRPLGCVLLEKKSAIIPIMQMVNETEARHIETVRESLGPDADARDCATLGRCTAITEATIEVGLHHFHYITKRNGPANVEINQNGEGLPSADPPGGCGCAPLLILGGIVFSSGGLVIAFFSAFIHSVIR
jgi:hypothetical protein